MAKPGHDHHHDNTHDKDRPSSRLILLAVITGAHGIKGAVKVKPFTEAPENISAYGSLQDAAGKAYDIRITRQVKDQLICQIKGINDRNAAEALAKTRLYIDRAHLPDEQDTLYQTDMLGAKICDADHQVIGTLSGFFDFGGGEMIEVQLLDGRRVMLPFQNDHRINLDINTQMIQMHIDPIWLEATPTSKPKHDERND